MPYSKGKVKPYKNTTTEFNPRAGTHSQSGPPKMGKKGTVAPESSLRPKARPAAPKKSMRPKKRPTK